MGPGFCLVITSIAGPTPALVALAGAAADAEVDFILVGDAASPGLDLDGCEFYSLPRQLELDFELASICPVRSYARKNIGYLLAMQRGASVIVETDDDTAASKRFWAPRSRFQHVRSVEAGGWVNVYRYFSDSNTLIWPRGFPLDHARMEVPPYERLPVAEVDCPIQQGLVDDDPDVDAVYRMLFQLPFTFERRAPVALGPRSWCPFNSQNTTWWRDAFPLLYLPASCSFRMTDIWRSFIAQRIGWENGWCVSFNEATVRQDRNEHDLSKDFADEVDGYLANRAICAALERLELVPGVDHLAGNMRRAYGLLVEHEWLDEGELVLLEAWLADVEAVLGTAATAVRS